MKKNFEKLSEMSAADLMVFVKDCCNGNEEVTEAISVHSGCILQWVKEANGFVIFTVLAGRFDGKQVRDAQEYITVSYNVNTEELFCITHYRHDNCGYYIYIESGQNCIKQEIVYGFGGWTNFELNFDLTVKSKLQYGCIHGQAAGCN